MAYDAGDYAGALDKALALADYKGPYGERLPRLRANFAASESSAYIEACGIAPSAAVGSLAAGVGLWESAEVRVNPIGTVEVLTGSHSHGQGHETTFAQLVSSSRDPDGKCIVIHGDTGKLQMGMGTYGSRSGAVAWPRFQGPRKIEAKAKKVAGPMLKASEGDMAACGKGSCALKGNNKSMN